MKKIKLKLKLSSWFNSPKKWATWMLSLVIIFTAYFLILDRYAPSTDDAVIQAYVLNISSYDAGKIDFLNLQNNSFVSKDQILFRLDPAEYLFNLNKAQADLILAQELVKQYSEGVLIAQDKLKQAQADFDYQDSHFQALKKLYEDKVISRDDFNQAQNKEILTKQLVFSAQQSVMAAQELLGPDIKGVNVHVFQAQSEIDNAELNLNRTEIKSPSDGFISNLQIQPGSYISAGESALSLIQNNFWVQANFKENDLERIQVGQKVWVTINNYPGEIFEGEVESLSQGVSVSSDGRGMILPSIDKTNNWVNLAQRFPVQIKINTPKNYILRVGATCIVTVRTSNNFVINKLAELNQWIRAMAQYMY